jgi:hypothetical protein
VIVYIESNFLFELGLARDGRDACETLLQWCEAGRIQLRLPAFAIPEVRGALRKREAGRLEAMRLLNAQRDDARRHSAADAPTFEAAQLALQMWTDREAEQIDQVMGRLLHGPAEFVELDHDALANDDLLRTVKALSGDGDLLIFACILRDLVRRRNAGDPSPSMFVTADADYRSVREWLRPYSCDLITSYSTAVARLKGLSP